MSSPAPAEVELGRCFFFVRSQQDFHLGAFSRAGVVSARSRPARRAARRRGGGNGCFRAWAGGCTACTFSSRGSARTRHADCGSGSRGASRRGSCSSSRVFPCRWRRLFREACLDACGPTPYATCGMRHTSCRALLASHIPCSLQRSCDAFSERRGFQGHEISPAPRATDRSAHRAAFAVLLMRELCTIPESPKLCHGKSERAVFAHVACAP